MNLDDKLKELKEEVPKVDSSLEEKIYVGSKQNATDRNPIFNKLTLSICGIVIVLLILIIGPISFRGSQNNPMDSTIKLLHTVDEPTEYISPAPTQNQFYQELGLFSGKLAKVCLDNLESEKNVVMSPASIFSALALVAECTNGNTRKEILDAIGMSYDVLEKNYARFYQSLNEKEQSTNKIKSKLTNSLWLNKNYIFKEDCLSSLASKYFCYSHSVDYSDIDYVSKYISDFIAKQTNNFLKPPLQLDDAIVFLLLNTLYIKDAWNALGNDLKYTDKEYQFKDYNNQIISRQFLKGDYKIGRAIYKENYKQFYTKTNEYTLTFIVPQNGNTIEEVFTSEVISNVRNNEYIFSNHLSEKDQLETYYTRCLFPEFSAESILPLKNIFLSLGVQDLFDWMYADFTNISSDKLVCSNATHYAKLVVDKKGIEGAAATIIEVAPGSTPPEKEIYEDFLVDESFGFVITNSRGVNLFSGIIRNI